MTPRESELIQELHEKSRQLEAITKQASDLQTRITELELAMSRIFSETVRYAK